MRRALALTIALAAAVLIPAAGASAKTVKVGVFDNYFAPATVKVKKNDRVNWKWEESFGDNHNVTLTKGPKGVKKGCKTKGKDAYSPLISKCNKSATGSTGIKFKKKMDKKGTYKFVCTLHFTEMQMTVKVK